MFKTKENLLDWLRLMWGGETYNNQPANTMMTSKLFNIESDGTKTYYGEDIPEPGLFRMCFTIEGIEDQLNKFEDSGLIYYFDPRYKGLDNMIIDKTKWL